MARFDGITLLSELVKKLEVQVSVRFHRADVAEVWFAVEIPGVGIYPGHVVFANDGSSLASVSTLPTAHIDDVSHLRGECPPSLEPILRELSLRLLNQTRIMSTTSPVGKESTAHLKRTGDGFELDRWADS
jgi:hypothetical protein